MRLTLVGHSTVVIEPEGGPRIITDPWFSRSIFRAVRPALTVDEVEPCELVLVSHKHLDHLDRKTAQIASRWGSDVLGPEIVARKIKRKGYEGVTPVLPDERLERFGVRITVTRAVHPLVRGGAVGYLIEADRTVYFSGDTRAESSVLDDVRNRAVDIAIVQIACGNYLGREFGMNMRSAAEFVKEIEPEIAIPVHYFSRGKTVDPERFVELLEPPVRGMVLPPGRSVRF